MATEKTLNTRIQLKYDTYENWTTNNPVLKPGEVAIATIDTGDTQEVNSVIAPQVLIKVGDGTHEYTELKFISGLAADVHGWAKAPTKPSYKASEIDELESFIAGEIQDTDTQYQIVKGADDYTYKLQSKALDKEKWTDVSPITIPKYDDSGVIAAIEALEGLVGTTAVATQIANAITALDDTYAAKEHTHSDYELKTDANEKLEEAKEYTDSEIATLKTYADSLLAANDAMVFKGVIIGSGLEETITTNEWSAGWTWKCNEVLDEGVVWKNSPAIELGDMIIATKDHPNVALSVIDDLNEYFAVIQTNIDGAVTTAFEGAAESKTVGQGNLVLYSDSTGYVIDDSNISAADVQSIVKNGFKGAIGEARHIPIYSGSDRVIEDSGVSIDDINDFMDTLSQDRVIYVTDEDIDDGVNFTENVDFIIYTGNTEGSIAVIDIPNGYNTSYKTFSVIGFDRVRLKSGSTTILGTESTKPSKWLQFELKGGAALVSNKWTITEVDFLSDVIQTASAGTGLKAEVANNNVNIDFDDTVTFVFNCGSSTEVMD